MGAGAEAALDVVLRLRNQAREELQGLSGQFASLGRQAAQAGMALTAGVTLPLVAIGKQALETAASFESQMNVLTVAARASGTSMEELSAAALGVGKDTQLIGINASQAADAMTNFYKAGLDTADIFGGQLNQYLQEGTNLTGALRSAIDLAAASELELSGASMLVATSMATFGIDATETARIVNSFVGAADASMASVAGLGQALENIGPTAAAFGWSLEETNTALALLSTRGILGAEAGTALKSMMTNLMSGTKETKTALAELNISLYDQAGAMRSLPDIVGQLSRAMAGMTEQQRNQYVQTLAGTYGMKSLNTLLAEGESGWQAMAEKIAAAASAQEVAAARTKGLASAWEQLQGALETLYITVGLPLVQNFVTPLVQKVTALISGIADLNPQVLQAAVAFAAVLAAIGPTLLAITGAAKVFGSMKVAVGLVGTALKLLGVALGGISAPVWVVIAAVGALAAAWTTNFGGIRDKTQAIIDGVIGKFNEIKNYLDRGEILMAIRATFGPDAVVPIGTFVLNAKQQIEEFIGKARETVSYLQQGELLMAIRTAFGPDAVVPIGTFVLGVQSRWEELKRTFTEGGLPAVGELLGTWIAEAITFIQTNAPLWGAQIQTAIKNAWKYLTESVLPAVGEVLEGWWKAGVKWVTDNAPTWGANIKTAITTAWNYLTDNVLPAVGEKLAAWWAAAVKYVEDNKEAWGTNIKTAIKAAWDALTQVTLPAVAAKLKEWWDEAVKYVTDNKDTWGKQIQAAVQPAWEYLSKDLPSAVADLSKAFETEMPKVVTQLDAVRDAIGKIKDTEFGKTLNEMSEGMGGLHTAMGPLAQVWDDQGENVKKAKKAFDDVVQAIKDVNKFCLELNKVVKEAKDKFQEWVNAGVLVVLGALEKLVKPISDFITKLTESQKKMDEVSPVAKIFGQALDAISGAANGISEAVKGAIDWLGKLADAIRNLPSPPSIFRPGSPTPFETGLRGISEAAQEAATQGLPAFSQAVQSLGGSDLAGTLRRTGYGLMMSLGGGLSQGHELVLGQLTGQIKQIVGAFKELAEWAAGAGSGFGSAKAALDPLGEMMQSLQTVLDALDALAAWSPRTGIEQKIGPMIESLKAVITQFADLSGWGATQWGGTNIVYAAKAILDPIGEMAPSIEAAVSALAEIADYRTALSLVEAGTARAVAALQAIIQKLAEFGRGISEEELADALGVTAIIGLLAKGLQDVPTVLGVIEQALSLSEEMIAGFTIPPLARLRAVGTFIADLVREVGEQAGLVSDELRKAAKALAEAAGPVLDLLSKTLGVLVLMEDYVPVADVALLKRRLGIIGDFVDELVRVMGRVGQAVAIDLQTAAKTLAESVGPVLDVISDALKAIGVLGTPIYYADILTWNIGGIDSPLETVARFLGDVVAAFGRIGDLVADDLEAAGQALASAAGPVLDVISQALAQIGVLGTPIYYADILTWNIMGLESPLQTVARFIGDLVTALGEVGEKISQDLMDAAVALAKAAGPVLDVIEKAITAIGLVAEYVPVPDMAALDVAMGQIVTFTATLVRKLGEEAVLIDEDVRNAAKELASVAGAALGIVTQAIAAIVAVKAYVPVPDITALDAAIGQIVTFTARLVTRLGEEGKLINEDVRAAASALGQAAGPVLGIVKSAIDAINAVKAYIPIPDITALDAATAQVMAFAARMVIVFGWIGEQVDEDVRAAASALASAAGPVLGMVRGAIEALEAVKSYVPVPDITSLDAAAAQVMAFAARLVIVLGWIGEQVDEDTRAAASALATAAGPVLGMVKTAIEALEAVKSYVPVPDLASLDAATGQVITFTARLVTKLGEVAASVSGPLQTAATGLAQAGSAALGIVKPAIEAILAVKDYVPVPDMARLDTGMGQIATFVGNLVTKLGQVRAQVGGLATGASEFIGVANPALELLRTALKDMVNLSWYLPIPDLPGLEAGMGKIVGFVKLLVQRLGEAATEVDAELRDEIRDFAAVATQVFGLLQSTMATTVAIRSYVPLPDLGAVNAVMNDMITYVTTVAGRVRGITQSLTEDTLEAGDTLQRRATSVRDVIQNAVTEIGKISTIQAPAVGLDWITQLSAGIAGAKPTLDAQLTAVQQAFADAQTNIRVSAWQAGYNAWYNLAEGLKASISLVYAQLNSLNVAFLSVLGSIDFYQAGYNYMSDLARGITAGLGLVEASLQSLANLFPHSPAKEGPLRVAPDWQAFLTGGLGRAVGEVAGALSGVGMLARPNVGTLTPAFAPAVAPVGRGGGMTVIQFTYAPAVSLASQREAEETIAPVLVRVLAREGRR